LCKKFPKTIKKQKPSPLFEVVLKEEEEEEKKQKKNPTFLLKKEFLAQNVFQRTWETQN
jgi:hypothetical protein